MSNQTDLQQAEEFVLKLIKSGRVYTAQEKADMKAKAIQKQKISYAT